MIALSSAHAHFLHSHSVSLLQMCNIPQLSTQLDLLLTLRELPISIDDLQPVSLLHRPRSQIKGRVTGFKVLQAEAGQNRSLHSAW